MALCYSQAVKHLKIHRTKKIKMTWKEKEKNANTFSTIKTGHIIINVKLEEILHPLWLKDVNCGSLLYGYPVLSYKIMFWQTQLEKQASFGHRFNLRCTPLVNNIFLRISSSTLLH